MEGIPNAYLLIGLPGSGKSTFARRMLQMSLHPVVINRDSLRKMIYGDVYNFDTIYEPMIKQMAYSCANDALTAGFSVIVDETNLGRSKRKDWIDFFNTLHIDVEFIYFPKNGNNVEYRMCDGRGYSKEYWAEVIANMERGFEEPSLAEGVKNIYTITDPNKDNLPK